MQQLLMKSILKRYFTVTETNGIGAGSGKKIVLFEAGKYGRAAAKCYF